ncbi:hypothetical protein GCM10027425_03540 [Alteromonas gracilis]
MHRLLIALLAAVALALTGCGSSDSTSGTDLDVEAFADRVAVDGMTVLDVRTPAEFAEGHLPGAVNVDVSAPDFGQRIADLDPEAAYAVYCRSGSRSAEALRLMQEAGFDDVAHLDGGITEWQASGGEVVS